VTSSQKKVVCLTGQTLYNIPMGKTAAKFKAPDDEKDRGEIVKETKRDLDEMLNEPAPIGNLAELVKALKKAKKKK
jgi:hypothetical protein